MGSGKPDKAAASPSDDDLSPPRRKPRERTIADKISLPVTPTTAGPSSSGRNATSEVTSSSASSAQVSLSPLQRETLKGPAVAAPSTSTTSAAVTTRHGPFGRSPLTDASWIHHQWTSRPSWLPRTTSEVESNDPRYAGRVTDVTTPKKPTGQAPKPGQQSPSPYQWYNEELTWTPSSKRRDGDTDKVGPADPAQITKSPHEKGTRAPFFRVPPEGRLDLSQIASSSAGNTTAKGAASGHAARKSPDPTVGRSSITSAESAPIKPTADPTVGKSSTTSAKLAPTPIADPTVGRSSTTSVKSASTKPIAGPATATQQTTRDTPAKDNSTNARSADATVSGSATLATPGQGSAEVVTKVHQTRARAQRGKGGPK